MIGMRVDNRNRFLQREIYLLIGSSFFVILFVVVRSVESFFLYDAAVRMYEESRGKDVIMPTKFLEILQTNNYSDIHFWQGLVFSYVGATIIIILVGMLWKSQQYEF